MHNPVKKDLYATITDPLDFAFFCDFLKKTSGYHLVEEKKYLLESRLNDILRRHHIADIKSLIQRLRTGQPPHLERDVIEAMTVNETFFFRDRSPFETFEQKILPKLSDWKENRPFRIWSAACSTGQEPYSIAMIIEDNQYKYPHATYEIIATDINTAVLKQAEKGVFTDLEIERGLSEHHRNKFFTRKENGWQISDAVRRHVKFSYMNLTGAYDVFGQFDMVLLRNVLIYFNETDKEKILQNIARKMYPSGYLLLGAAEGIFNPGHFFQRCDEIKGLYKLNKT